MELSHFDLARFLFKTEAGFRKGENDSWTPLQNASYHGDLHTVQYLIGRGVDLEKADDDGWTPLHFASCNRHLDVVQFLIGKGADVGKKDDKGTTSLQIASRSGYLEIVQYLTGEGADLEKADNNGRTPLHMASFNGHLQVVQYLIGIGADIGKADNHGITPLHEASYNGHLDVVQHLINKGAEVDKGDNDGSTPLHLASYNSHLEVVQYLSGEGADLEKADNGGSTPLHDASYNGHLDVVQYLSGEGADLEKPDDNGRTPLHKASYNGHLDVIQHLISKRAELDKGDNNGSTPLHKASYNGHLDVVHHLSSKGAELDKGDNDGSTPLHKASYSGHLEVVQYLIGKGANFEKADNGGSTPLHCASYNGHLDVVQNLISEGAELDKGDNNGRTPLHKASYNGHLEVVQYLIGEGADLDKADNDGSTPLRMASYNGHLEVVHYLTGKGVDLETTDNDGRTPLHDASYNGHLEVVQNLTGKGANLEKADDHGSTPLHEASYSGHLEVVEYLVNKGANLKKLDNDGRTPLSIASNQGHDGVVQYLRYEQQQYDNDQMYGSRKESLRTDAEVDQELSEHSYSEFDLGEIVERSSSGAGASIDRSSQRVIRLEKHQIEVQIHPRETWGVEDITVRAITEVPIELLNVLQENEAIICVGLEMTPSDAKFSTPVKVTMPHSAIFTRLHNSSFGTYYRKNSSDSFSSITFADGDSRCVVRERDLDLYIDHFSEWWIIAFITRTFFGKRVICTPFVPESNPRNAEHRVRLCIRDNNIGKAEPEPGYLAPVKGEEFFIAWRSGELKVNCIADNKDIGTKIRRENVFHRSVEVNIPFIVNTTNTDKSRVFVQFILEQNASIDIICPISFKDLEDGRFEAPSCSDSLLSQSSQSQTPETLGRVDAPDQMSPSGLPDPTPEGETQSPADSREVTDAQLLSLSRELLPGHFSALYVALGIPAGIAESIRVEKMNNYPETYMQLLQLWKAESKRTLVDLDQVLVKARAKGLKLQKVGC